MNSRKSEILNSVSNIDHEIINPLVDQIVFLEERLEYLKTLPFIRVNENNPSQQKATPAAKLYKELLQQYTNCVKVLLKQGDDGEERGKSPLREWAEKYGKFEKR